MSEERKITFLDRLKIVDSYLSMLRLSPDRYDKTTIDNLRADIKESIKIASKETVKEKLSEELVQRVENKLTNSYVKIQWPNTKETTYTKLNYVKLFGDNNYAWIEYSYDFSIDIHSEEKYGSLSYCFVDEDKKIKSPYKEEFNFSDDIEDKIYQHFKIINKDEFDEALNQIINTMKLYA